TDSYCTFLHFNQANMKVKMQFNFIKQLTWVIMILSLSTLFIACKTNNSSPVMEETFEGEGDDLERVTQVMVAPPNVPEHEQVASGGPKVVEVTFEIQEKKIAVDEGDSIWAMTFNGSVPGPLIIVHQNDFVELTLKNPVTNTQIHNIDFHAATGEMGGGEISMVNPGQQVKFRFRATRTGVFVYHCAPGGMMVPMHVVSGMNGAIMVLPRDGLKDEVGNLVEYDRAFYIVEQDFYLPKDEAGNFKNIATPQQSMQEMESAFKTLTP